MLLLLIQYFCKFKWRIFYANVKLTVPFTDYLGVQLKKNKTWFRIKISREENKNNIISFYVQILVTLQKCSMFHTLISVVSLTLLSLKCRVGPSGRWVTTSPSNTELKKYTIKLAETTIVHGTTCIGGHRVIFYFNIHTFAINKLVKITCTYV